MTNDFIDARWADVDPETELDALLVAYWNSDDGDYVEAYNDVKKHVADLVEEQGRRRDAAVEQCRHLHQDGKTREQWHLDACGAFQRLRAAEHALSDEIADRVTWGDGTEYISVEDAKRILRTAGTTADQSGLASRAQGAGDVAGGGA